MKMQAKISIMVRNMNRSIDFYTKKLGFKLGFRYENDFAYLTGFGIALGLSEDNSKYCPDKGNLSICFEVKDMGKAVSDLKKKGLSFEFDEDEDCRFASFEDPDSTPLYLVEKK
ncbi:MAG: VOC family protein [archaeon]